MPDLVDVSPRQVLPLFRALHSHHVARLPELFHNDASDAQFLEVLEGLQNQGAFCLAHDAGWGLVSYLLALPQPRPGDALRRGVTRLCLDHLYVAPTHRGRGLARALIAVMEQRMAHQGYREWVVSHHGFNTGAGALYESLGAAPGVITRVRRLGSG